ncbi:MAG: hypothetical protein EOP61_31570 [Sphingomonadales bacterium]|nr:MAG: hypothetical protein EOP61_31570 [Sphingomonadales bacterium]
MGEGMAEEEKADEVAHVELAEGWPRLWARLLDSWLNLLLIGAVVGILFPALFQMPAFEGRRGDLLLDVAFLPLALMLDAGIQALFGNTLGKWLVGIRLEQIDGGRPSTVTTLQRNLRLYVQGFILGLPLLNLFGMARANDRLSREGATLWDAALGTRVVDRAGHILRTVFTAGLALTLNIGGTVHDLTDAVGRLLLTALSMIAEFEADLARARTREGLAMAKAKGRLRGKPPKLKATQEAHLVKLWHDGDYSALELGELFNVSRATVYRAIQRSGTSTASS